MSHLNRRDFLRRTSAWAAGAGIFGATGCMPSATAGSTGGGTAAGVPLYKMSLAEFGLHRALRSGELDHLDFAPTARRTFGLDAVEYVNQFFMDRATDQAYLRQMKMRAEDAGVRSLLIMVDQEGNLGDPDPAQRTQAVENHYKWVEAAKFLDCHSVRVNAYSRGTWDEQLLLFTDGMQRLIDFAEGYDLNVIVENHGGLSSNGAWLAALIERVDHPRAGTLPDFGNFRITQGPPQPGQQEEWYDRYRGMQQLMPYARGIGAKSIEFDESGNETHSDFRRMMRIVLDAGYRGYVGVEYEGTQVGEVEGNLATIRLLERVRNELTPQYA